MNRPAPLEIRRRALSAAAAVALFTGSLACGSAPSVRLDESARSSESSPAPDAGADPAGRDASAEADAAEAVPDAGLVVVDASSLDAGTIDAGDGPCGPISAEGWERCCQESGWSAPGCLAWGPPMPPAMERA
jgi:hypothetical protein